VFMILVSGIVFLILCLRARRLRVLPNAPAWARGVELGGVVWLGLLVTSLGVWLVFLRSMELNARGFQASAAGHTAAAQAGADFDAISPYRVGTVVGGVGLFLTFLLSVIVRLVT